MIAQVDKAIDDHKRKPLLVQQKRLQQELKEFEDKLLKTKELGEKDTLKLKILIRVSYL